MLNVRRAADTVALRVQKKANRAAVNKAATPMLKEVKEFVPYDTGNLERSLVKRVRTEKTGVVAARIAPSRKAKGVRYAHIVELGSSKMAPRPYMRPGFQNSKWESMAVYKRVIWDDIKKAAAKEHAKNKGKK